MKMVSYINPVFLFNIAKSYLSDLDLLWNYDSEKLRKYQNKAFRKMVKYAYSVPLYNQKFKEKGVKPSDIRGIDDIGKLPLISKNDLQRNYPDNIIPANYNKGQGYVLSTSGSTGQPVFVYNNLFSSIKGLIAFARELKAYGGSWNKSRVALVIDIAPGGVEYAFFTNSITPILKRIVSLDNIKYIHVAEKTDKIMNELNEFKPEFLGSDPNMLREIAYQKNNKKGENINPKCIFSGGATLDSYSRNYVKNTFGVYVYDTYGTTEAGPIAFECIDSGFYHVNSDLVFLEFIDEDDNAVAYGKSGRIVATKLYGKGTPIIRYTGLGDRVIHIEKGTGCGITSQMIKQIDGRSMELIFLPDGKTIAPFHVTTIPAYVMKKLETYKIKQFQIIQHKPDDIEVKVVIDKKIKEGVSKEKIFEELKKLFIERTKNQVDITINEVEEIQKGVSSDYTKLIISKIKDKHLD